MPLALEGFPLKRGQELSFTSRPNCSLSNRGRKTVFWLVAGATLLISSVFAALGYWLMLPFAGMEIGVLAWAFEMLASRRGDYETLTISEDEVVMERRHDGRMEHLQFNRQWVSLIQKKERAGGRVSVALRSQGRETELGVFLTDEARAELAAALLTRIRETR